MPHSLDRTLPRKRQRKEVELELGLEVEDEEMIKEQLRQDKNLPVDAGAVRG